MNAVCSGRSAAASMSGATFARYLAAEVIRDRPTQDAVVAHLATSTGEMTTTQLVEALGLSRRTVRVALHRAIQAGWVRRRRVPATWQRGRTWAYSLDPEPRGGRYVPPPR